MLAEIRDGVGRAALPRGDHQTHRFFSLKIGTEPIGIAFGIQELALGNKVGHIGRVMIRGGTEP